MFYGAYTAYRCIKPIYIGTFNGGSISFKKDNIVLFDLSTIEILDTNFAEFNNRPRTYTGKKYFLPSFQKAIDGGFFIPISDWDYGNLEVQEDDAVVSSDVNKFNFFGPGVNVTVDPLDPKKVNVEITGGGGGPANLIQSDEGEYFCPNTVGVGKVVYISGLLSVDYTDSGTPLRMPAIGVVIDKPSSLTATIAYSGEVDVFTGLNPGSIYYANSSGGISTTAPSSGIIQRIGIAMSPERLILSIGDPFLKT